MRDKVQELFQSRPQRSRPSYHDWQTFLDLITYAFVLNRDAPIYTAYLGAKNLTPTINAAVDALQSMSSLAADRIERTTVVNQVSLAASKRNLQRFGDTIGNRGVNDSTIPSLEVFNDHVDRSLDSMRGGVGSSVSPEEARTRILEQLTAFKELEAFLSSKTLLLYSSLDTYLGLNLRGVGLSELVGRAGRVIAQLQDDASANTLALKNAIEDLIAIKSSVNRLSQVMKPDAVIVTSTGAASGTGTAASIVSGRSGPWNFASAAAGQLVVDIDGTVVAITAPSATKAVATTLEAKAYPVIPLPSGLGWPLNCQVAGAAPPFTLRIRVDDGPGIDVVVPTYVSAAPPPVRPYVDYNDMTLALAVAGLTVTSPSPGVLQIERDDPGQDNSFRLSATTFPIVSGVCEPIGDIGLSDSGELKVPIAREDKAYRGVSVTVEDLIKEIELTTDLISSTRQPEEYIRGTYGYLSGPQQLSVYKIQDTAGGLGVTAGSRVVTSDTYNFVGKQVRVGDTIKFDGQAFSVVSVSESTVTLDADHTSSTGSYNFDVFPDTSGISAQDLVDVYARDYAFSSSHRVTAVTDGLIDIEDYFFYDSITVEFSVYEDQLLLKSKKVDVDSSIEVLPASTANTELDFPLGQVRGTVSGYSDGAIDFRDVAVLKDDLLRVYGDFPIESIGQSLSLYDEIRNDTSGTYSLVNPDREEFDSFMSYLGSWRNANLGYGGQIDSWLIPILFQDPNQDVITSFQSKIASLVTQYQSLRSSIQSMSIRRLQDIDDVFALLLDGGYDRARDILIFADFATFFELEAEEATYQGKFQLEAQDFDQTYLEADQFEDQTATELEEYVLPDLQSTALGTRE